MTAIGAKMLKVVFGAVNPPTPAASRGSASEKRGAKGKLQASRVRETKERVACKTEAAVAKRKQQEKGKIASRKRHRQGKTARVRER